MLPIDHGDQNLSRILELSTSLQNDLTKTKIVSAAVLLLRRGLSLLLCSASLHPAEEVIL